MSIPLPAFVAIPLATAFLLPMFGKRGKDADCDHLIAGLCHFMHR